MNSKYVFQSTTKVGSETQPTIDSSNLSNRLFSSSISSTHSSNATLILLHLATSICILLSALQCNLVAKLSCYIEAWLRDSLTYFCLKLEFLLKYLNFYFLRSMHASFTNCYLNKRVSNFYVYYKLIAFCILQLFTASKTSVQSAKIFLGECCLL